MNAERCFHWSFCVSGQCVHWGCVTCKSGYSNVISMGNRILLVRRLIVKVSRSHVHMQEMSRILYDPSTGCLSIVQISGDFLHVHM